MVYTVQTGMVELLRVGICGRWCSLSSVLIFVGNMSIIDLSDNVGDITPKINPPPSSGVRGISVSFLNKNPRLIGRLGSGLRVSAGCQIFSGWNLPEGDISLLWLSKKTTQSFTAKFLLPRSLLHFSFRVPWPARGTEKRRNPPPLAGQRATANDLELTL